jgi:hypothetical protein
MAGLVPAMTVLRGAVLQAIGITGTRPVMTGERGLLERVVL